LCWGIFVHGPRWNMQSSVSYFAWFFKLASLTCYSIGLVSITVLKSISSHQQSLSRHHHISFHTACATEPTASLLQLHHNWIHNQPVCNSCCYCDLAV
jgi:hypothetical protein